MNTYSEIEMIMNIQIEGGYRNGQVHAVCEMVKERINDLNFKEGVFYKGEKINQRLQIMKEEFTESIN